jgi:hypothetical protein
VSTTKLREGSLVQGGHFQNARSHHTDVNEAFARSHFSSTKLRFSSYDHVVSFNKDPFNFPTRTACRVTLTNKQGFATYFIIHPYCKSPGCQPTSITLQVRLDTAPLLLLTSHARTCHRLVSRSGVRSTGHR